MCLGRLAHDGPAMIIINLLGIVVFLISAGVGVGIANTLGYHGEGLPMLIGGPLMVVLDIGYRRLRDLRLVGARGPALFWLPMWLWGVFWTGLGVYYVMHHR